MHAPVRNGTSSLTSLPKEDEASCEVRPPEVTHPEFDPTRLTLTSVTYNEKCQGTRPLAPRLTTSVPVFPLISELEDGTPLQVGLTNFLKIWPKSP